MVTREAPSITTEECDPKSGNVFDSKREKGMALKR